MDPNVDHTAFMEACAERGIYVTVPVTGAVYGILDASRNSPGCYTDIIPVSCSHRRLPQRIDANDSVRPSERSVLVVMPLTAVHVLPAWRWNGQGYGDGRTLGTVLVEYALEIVKEFSAFNNAFSFVVGNEVYLHSTVGFGCIPCVKALVRDIHAWQRGCLGGVRAVPLVYAAQHQPATIQMWIANYLSCQVQEHAPTHWGYARTCQSKAAMHQGRYPAKMSTLSGDVDFSERAWL